MAGSPSILFFFFNDTATTEIYTLSLHDALPIYPTKRLESNPHYEVKSVALRAARSEEHTSELQSRRDLVCRLLLEKNKTKKQPSSTFLRHTGIHGELPHTHTT